MRPPSGPAVAADWDALWTQAEPGPRPGVDAAPRVPDSLVLRELFGTTTRTAPSREDEEGDGWPRHNYNAAYESLAARKERRRTPRRNQERQRLEVWDVEEAIGDAGSSASPVARPAALPTPLPAAHPVTAPRSLVTPPEPRAAVTAGAWLDLLADSARPSDATEAQVIRTLWGDPRRVTAPLFEATDVLRARARVPATVPERRIVVHVPATRTRRSVRARTLLVALAGLAVGLTTGAAMMVFLFT